MAALLAGSGAALYEAASVALLDELDTGLRARAAAIEADLPDPGFGLVRPPPELLEPTEVFAQIVSREGDIIDSTPGITAVAVPDDLLGSLTAPRFSQARVAGVVGTARILALPTRLGSTPVVLVVGTEMSDRHDALNLIIALLSIGGPVAVVIASVIGWLLAGAALRPIETMRRQASAISASGVERRLTVPQAEDEFRRLAVTLNDMLSRLDASMMSERRFLDTASHELRTPLTALKTELDVALLRPRTREELEDALRSASEETDRLARMADDLLVLSRAQGQLRVLRTPSSLQTLLTASARLFDVRARAAGVRIDVDAPEATVLIDHARVRQAVDNLLDNALRYAPTGSVVSLRAAVRGCLVTIMVDDAGPGFPATRTTNMADPLLWQTCDGTPARTPQRTGLGLAIVRAVVEGHGGTVTIEAGSPNGARVVLSLPIPSAPDSPMSRCPSFAACGDRAGPGERAAR